MRKHINALLGAIWIAVLASGCAHQTSISQDSELDPASGVGIAFASIIYDGNYSEHSIYFSGQTEGRLTFGESIQLLPILPAGDFSEADAPNGRGSVVSAQLPAGKYVVEGWRLSSGNVSIGPTQEIELPFVVLPGRATYLGEYVFVQGNFFGLQPGSAYIRWNRQGRLERDLSILKSRHPQLRIQSADVKTVDLPLEKMVPLGPITAQSTVLIAPNVPAHK